MFKAFVSSFSSCIHSLQTIIIIIISMNRNSFFYCMCVFLFVAFNSMRKPNEWHIRIVDFKERNINEFGQLCRSHLWARMQIFNFLIPVVSKHILNGIFLGTSTKGECRISLTYHSQILRMYRAEVYYLMYIFIETKSVFQHTNFENLRNFN